MPVGGFAVVGSAQTVEDVQDELLSEGGSDSDLTDADGSAPMFLEVLGILEATEDLVCEGEAIPEDGVIFEGSDVDDKAAGGEERGGGERLGEESALDGEAVCFVVGELVCADEADAVGSPVEGETSGDEVLSFVGPDDDIVAVDTSDAQAPDDGSDGGGLDAGCGGSSGVDQDADFVTGAEPCTPRGLAVGLSCKLHDELCHHIADECGVGCGLVGAENTAASDVNDVSTTGVSLSTDHLSNVHDGT